MNLDQYTRGDCGHCSRRGHCTRQIIGQGGCDYQYGEPKYDSDYQGKVKQHYKRVPQGNPCVEGYSLGDGLKVKPLAMEHVKGFGYYGKMEGK